MKQSVYVMLADDSSVKIGISNDVPKRIKSIQLASGKIISDYFETDQIDNARSIEKRVHETLSEYRIVGEWFNVEYNHAINIVSDVFDDLASVSEENSSETKENTLKKYFNALGNVNSDALTKFFSYLSQTCDHKNREQIERVYQDIVNAFTEAATIFMALDMSADKYGYGQNYFLKVLESW